MSQYICDSLFITLRYPPLLGLLGLKACHVAELPPLFGTLNMLGGFPLYFGDEKNAHAVGSRMRQYWGAFAHTGTPTPTDLPLWPMYDQVSRRVITFGRRDNVQTDPYGKSRILYEDLENPAW